MRDTLFIIGNGFDLHHELPTHYCDYKAFLRQRDLNLVHRMDELFQMNGIAEKDIKLWSNLEERTRFFPNLDFESLRDDAFEASEQDMDRASYWDDPQYIAGNYVKGWIDFYDEFTGHFKEWIDSIDVGKACMDEKLGLEKNALFLNFNYTKTLEIVYGIPAGNILYIHVNEGKYVFGNNQPKNIPYPNPEGTYIDEDGNESSDEDIRNVEVKKVLNGAYSTIYEAYFKNSDGLIKKYGAWFSQISKFRKIVFMAVSFGKEDKPYFDFISQNANNCNEWLFYYRSDDDLANAKKYAEKFNIQNAEYRQW